MDVSDGCLAYSSGCLELSVGCLELAVGFAGQWCGQEKIIPSRLDNDLDFYVISGGCSRRSMQGFLDSAGQI